MAIGDNDFDKENQKPDEEHVPDAPKQPDDDEDIPVDVPAPQPEDVPGIPVHTPERKARMSFAPMQPVKRYVRNARRKGTLVNAFLIAIGIGILIPAGWLLMNPLPDIKMLEHYSPIEAIKIYDIHDKLAAVVAGDEDRQSIKLSEVSPQMKKAMLAAEDHDFYSHGGFSLSSIVRAAIKNFHAGRVVEGASTISQQLVKNLFYPGEPRTFSRKIKEALLASQVNFKYSKDQILEMYLNQIYFGNQSYGIERAAQRYFNKPASKLDLAEGAFLAGVVKAPSYLSSPENRDAAIARQHEVLDKLAEYNLASKQEVEKAKAEKLAFRKFVSPYQKYPFYVAYVIDCLREKYGDEQMQRGLSVYTNLDPVAQVAAEKALEKGIGAARASGVEQGALVSQRIDDGAVLALVGGVGKYEKNQWNRAVSPHTMGSSFKPFVYLTGFMHGKDPEDIVVDAPVSFPSGGQTWSPRNFEGGFMGAMPIKKALGYSRNVCAAIVAHDVGIENVINTAHLAGLSSHFEPYLPICLGAGAASPLEMASAYSTFARGGIRMKPMVIRKVANNEGRVIAEYQPEAVKVFDSIPTSKLLTCMQYVVTNGTGILARLDKRPMAGKTGTSEAARDIWFVGFTADVATACWGGNDHEKAIHNNHVTGGMIMSKIWKEYMTAYYATHPTPALAFVNAAPNAPKLAIDGLTTPNAVASTDTAAADAKAKDDKKKLAQAAAVKAAAAKKLLAKKPIVQKRIEQAAVVEPEEDMPVVEEKVVSPEPKAEAKEEKTEAKVEAKPELKPAAAEAATPAQTAPPAAVQ